MEITIWRNNRNGNKYLDVVRYACGHYYAAQFMRYGPHESYNGTEIINWNGNTRNRRHRRRWRKANLSALLEDYSIYRIMEVK